VAWLRDHDIPAKRIAALLAIEEAHARQLAFRGQWRLSQPNIPAVLEDPFRPPSDPFGPVSDELRQHLGVRPRQDSWTVTLDLAERRSLEELESLVEQLGAAFWSGVRYGAGLARLRSVLQHIGRPAHYRRIRLLARLRYLIAETYAHAGYSSTAIEQAFTSMLLSKAAYDEGSESLDLERFGSVALLISQSYLLRHDPHRARYYLNLHRDARNRLGLVLGGEYFRQRGTAAFQTGDDEQARRNYGSAMAALAETVEYGRSKQWYEVLNIGTRQMNLAGKVNWDGAQELLRYMLDVLPPGEIHISMNVNWTAACGFATDSPNAIQTARELLERYRHASVGFGHQATVAWLLSLAPDLPMNIRPAWVRWALYENTFKDR
jgi:hypothetical protein